jgi:hypothetical protein
MPGMRHRVTAGIVGNLVLALSAQGSVPPAIRDDAFGWLVITMSSQLIVPAWYAPAGFSVPIALALPVAYWVGAEQMRNTDTRTTTAAAILLIMTVGVHACGRRQLYGRAAAADAALDDAACRTCCADEIGAVSSSRRGRAPPSTFLSRQTPPRRHGRRKYPSSAFRYVSNFRFYRPTVMPPILGS